MKNLFFGAILLAGLFAFPVQIQAQDGICAPGQTPTRKNPCIEKDLDLTDRSLIVRGINYLLGIAGGLAVLFLVIGGLRYITAGDDRDGTDHARRIIRGAITGLIFILLVFVLINAINAAVQRGTIS